MTDTSWTSWFRGGPPPVTAVPHSEGADDAPRRDGPSPQAAAEDRRAEDRRADDRRADDEARGRGSDDEAGAGWTDDEAGTGWTDDEAGAGWTDDEAGAGWADDEAGPRRPLRLLVLAGVTALFCGAVVAYLAVTRPAWDDGPSARVDDPAVAEPARPDGLPQTDGEGSVVGAGAIADDLRGLAWPEPARSQGATDLAAAAAAAMTVRTALSHQPFGEAAPDPSGAVRYVDLVVPEAVERLGALRIVTVSAVVLVGREATWEQVTLERWAVALDADARPLGEPWPVGVGSAGSGPAPVEPQWTAADAPAAAAVAQALDAAGWAGVDVTGAEHAGDLPGLLRATVSGRPAGHSQSLTVQVWLHAGPPPRLLGALAPLAGHPDTETGTDTDTDTDTDTGTERSADRGAADGPEPPGPEGGSSP